MVTQYNTKNFISKIPEPLGPYPMTVSQQRVTDETAAVAIAQDDSVLHVPNHIGPADFEGWVQERGLYFADKWDDRYAAPLAMNDPGCRSTGIELNPPEGVNATAAGGATGEVWTADLTVAYLLYSPKDSKTR